MTADIQAFDEGHGPLLGCLHKLPVSLKHSPAGIIRPDPLKKFFFCSKPDGILNGK